MVKDTIDYDKNKIQTAKNNIRNVSKNVNDIFNEITNINKSIKYNWTGKGANYYSKKFKKTINVFDDYIAVLDDSKKYLASTIQLMDELEKNNISN